MSSINKIIEVKNVKVSNDLPFALIAGPCQMESRDHALMMAEKLTEITNKLDIPFIYKSSFDKANRTSLNSKRGIGLEKALPIFAEIQKEFNCPTLTDVHNEEQCKIIDDSVDILQIPAFLCRQTDLLVTAAQTGKIINIKKGQFLAPWDMKNVSAKVSESGNDNVILTDRGTSFGYNTLISDMRGLYTMAETGYPVIIDATHSIQQPGGQGGTSGGQREFVPVIARSSIAVGIAGTFMEVHQDPNNAPSDGPCMVRLHELESILTQLLKIDQAVKDL